MDAAIVLDNLAAMAQSTRESGMDTQTFADDILAHKQDLQESARHAARWGGLEEDEAWRVLFETPHESTESRTSEVPPLEDAPEGPTKINKKHAARWGGLEEDEACRVLLETPHESTESRTSEVPPLEDAPPGAVRTHERTPEGPTKINKRVQYFKKVFDAMEKAGIVTMTRCDDVASNSIFGWSSMTPNVDKLGQFEATMDRALGLYSTNPKTRNMNFYLFMRRKKIGASKCNKNPSEAPVATSAQSSDTMNATMFSVVRTWRYYPGRS